MKTEKLMKWCAWMRGDSAVGDGLQFDNMEGHSIIGTTEWNQYSNVLDVPTESDFIFFGVLLIGEGKV